MRKAQPIKICVFTGARSEYGLLSPLIRALHQEKMFSVQLLVTGMHLSPEFGLTYKEIEKDGFPITEKVEMLLSSDTDSGIAKSTGLGIVGFADALNRMAPDAVLLLGDRFETFAMASAAYLMKIPVIHLHGGETTEGATDEGMRHAITKMAYLHFTSTEAYRKRVIQLGEDPKRVFNVGAIGLDNIRSLQLLKKAALEKELGISLTNPFAIVTFHPVTLEHSTADSQFDALAKALLAQKNLHIVFTYPNADASGRVIISRIRDFVQANADRAVAFPSLGVIKYLSAVKLADLVIGNSSSAIIEVPSLHKPVINIGDRQKGRVRAENVIDVEPVAEEISKAIRKALSDSFRKQCARIGNPYGDGRTARRIIGILKKALRDIDLKKKFFDIDA
jgi:UDP-hydrolysing UDP-N-acetyl-D-glucosamine 2-epimerase